MDSLSDLFSDSLSAELDARLAAEQQLTQLQSTVGFPSRLFSLVANAELTLAVRQAAAIYLKNLLTINYNEPPQQQQKINQQDVTFIKLHILHAIAHSPPSITALLRPSLAIIISVDYPLRWPDLLPHAITLLSSNQFHHIQAALLTILEIMRLYRWSPREKTELRSNAINLSFPSLLQLAQNQIHLPIQNYHLQPTPSSLSEANSNIGTILYLTLKIYKTSITAELPSFQQQHIIPWAQLFLAIINKPLKNSPGFPHQPHDAPDKWSWSKAKKWAYFIVCLSLPQCGLLFINNN